MICRIAKPSDSITVVHIPVITPPFGAKAHAHGGHIHLHHHSTADPTIATATTSTQEAAYFTLQEYKYQYERCLHRIDHLRAVYKSAGYNLLVDAIPTFQEEMYRQLVYVQRKNYFLAQMLQQQRQAAHKDPACSTSGSENNIAVRLFVQNQHTYHLAARLLAVTEKLDPSFLVLGAQGTDILKVLTIPPVPDNDISRTFFTESAAASRPSTVRNLDFPYQEVVADNTKDIPQLATLMAHHRTKRHKKAKDPDHDALAMAQWMEQFQLYAEQRIDLVEMVLHQYSNQCAASATSQALKTLGYHFHEDAPAASARFSFILSNSDCLK